MMSKPTTKPAEDIGVIVHAGLVEDTRDSPTTAQIVANVIAGTP